MPINYDSEKKIFKLDSAASSYVFEIFDEGYLVHLYYGAYIPDNNVGMFRDKGMFVSESPCNFKIGEGSFSPDVTPLEFSGEGSGDFRNSCIAVRNADGNNVTDMRYVSHKIYPGKPSLKGMPALFVTDPSQADTLEVTVRDSVTGIEAVLYYTVFNDCGAMARGVKVINPTDKTVYLERIMSCCVDYDTHDYDLITLYGKWSKERSVERSPLAHLTQGISSKRGSSSHHHNPFAALVDREANEDYGSAYGFNLVYSGNFVFDAEVEPFGGVRTVMGINPEGFEWTLEPGGEFVAPEAVTVYSNEGIGGMSRVFHKLYSKHLIRSKWAHVKRPLLINNWEATGMDFTGDQLVTFAERAKELGIDMLVMDDGWFGNRDSDKTALGDWFVNENKLGGPLGDFVKRINDLGIKFGIWFEPEMVSRDSDLYRAHPDWCIHVPGREKSIARHQYVLDFSREDVRDYIYGLMRGIIAENNIAYVKWDCNRYLSEVGSAALPKERQKETFHRYVLGVYDVLGRLTSDFPDLLLEGCASGGGRYDPGMLYYEPQIWCSDNTDPIERLSIQFGTSLCYPASTMGAHVSDSRRAGYETKGNIALWGTFGYELDPNTFTPEEVEIVKNQVNEYHKYYALIHEGELYRLITPDKNHFRAAWMFVSEDKNSALVTSVVMRKQEENNFYLKLKGLDPEKYYVEDESGEVYSGALLMNAGLCLNKYGRMDGDSFKLYFRTL